MCADPRCYADTRVWDLVSDGLKLRSGGSSQCVNCVFENCHPENLLLSDSRSSTLIHAAEPRRRRLPVHSCCAQLTGSTRPRGGRRRASRWGADHIPRGRWLTGAEALAICRAMCSGASNGRGAAEWRMCRSGGSGWMAEALCEDEKMTLHPKKRARAKGTPRDWPRWLAAQPVAARRAGVTLGIANLQ